MTLRSKTFLPLALLSVLFFLFLSGYWFPRSMLIVEREELRSTERHLDTVAEGLVPLLLAHQLDTVYENLDALLSQNKEWVAIRLVDPGGRLIYPLQEAPPVMPGKGVRVVEHRIRFLGNDLGNLTLTLDTSARISAVENRHRQLVTALLLVFCGYIISMGIIVERIVRKPVELLGRAAGRIAQGDFDVPLVRTGDDEVGALVDSFSRMRDSIREYQASLLESNRAVTRLSQAVQQSHVSIMITDTEGRLTFVNPSFSRVTGYTSAEVLGENPRLLKSGTTPVATYETLWQTITSGGIWCGELYNKRKNGEFYWESASISPIKDENGAIVSYLAVKEDITERKANEEALRKSEAALREAQRVAHIGSWELDLRATALTWSDEIYRIFELDPGSFSPSYEAFLNAIHPDDREQVNRAYSSSLETRGPYSITHRLLMPDGRVKYVHEQCRSDFDDNGMPLRSLGTVQDVTERTRAEHEVKSMRNYLSNIIDSMPSILVGMDRDGDITQWNRRAEETSGIAAREAIGKHLYELIPDFSPWIEQLRSEIEQRRPASMEKLLIEKQGERHFYDLVLYPLISNGVEGTVIRIEDATERTRIQELMIQTEKMMSVGGLAAGMAHEINNPLGIITQAIQNIERRVSPDLPANQKAAEEAGVRMDGLNAYFGQRQIPEFIASIREAAARASRIIANILRFSRRADTTLQPASLAAVMEQALELAANDYDLKKKYDFRSIEIVREIVPDMPDIPMVDTEIEQVLLNLFKNSAQAMIASPPERKPRITVRIRQEERYAVLEVEDNGPGMPEETRRRVFEPFFTTKEPGIGTGLGLSVSYMIVTQNHKGLMEVASTPGNGACFTVRLPLVWGEKP